VSALLELQPRRVNQDGLKTISSPSDSILNAWLLPDTMEVACYLAENGLYERVRRWLEPLLQHFPDVLMIALCTTNPSEPWSALQQDLSQALMPTFLSHHPNWRPVLEKVWASRPVVVMHGMVAWFKADPSNQRLTRIFDVAQDIKAISTLLDTGDAPFVLELAVMASYRGFLNLEKWLSDQLKKQPRAYAEACLRFLERRFQSNGNGDTLPPLQPPMFLTMVTCLEAVQPQVPPNLAASIGVLRSDWVPKLGPALVASNPGPGPPPVMALDGDLPPGLESTVPEPRLADANEPQPIREFSEQIDKEANMYFQRIYSGAAAVLDIISLLKGYKNSDKREETEVFHCMIRNLFDEYKFFPQYPAKELGITGTLFGSLIQNDLVYGRTLSTALRYVLEALKNEPESKMFEFGVAALKHFLPRLKEWPHFCDHIANTPHFQAMPQEVVAVCSTSRKRLNLRQQQASAAAAAAASTPASAQPPPSATSAPSSAAPALAPAAPEEKVSTPSEDVQDKISFIFNNLSPSNLQGKVGELRPLLATEHYKWFANYIVQMRAKREANFHHLYLDLLKTLAAKALDAAVLASTYAAIRALISSQSPEVASKQADRTILKNLGTFLGLQTLARNKPVLHRDLDLKALVLYAFEHGQMSMMLLVPFVAKVLDTSQYSRIFHAPNPWLMSMLGLFKELHSISDLKIALKFEVEVLCKSLKIAIDDITQTAALPRATDSGPSTSALLRNSNLGPSPGLSAGSPVFTPSAMNTSPHTLPSSLQSAAVLQPPRQAYPQLTALQPRSMQQYIETATLSILPLVS
jgi:CCR4-NOT transcription complex subunit 1